MNIDELIWSLGRHAHVVNELFDLGSAAITYDDDTMESARAELAKLLDRTNKEEAR